MCYISLNEYLKERFGAKVYKLALNAGMTCPNRDGKLGTRGCIFCSEGGSGDFAAPSYMSIEDQIEYAIRCISKKLPKQYQSNPNEVKFIAYFQAYTNTYAPVMQLRNVFFKAIERPDIVAISIATRPDCLPDEVLELLAEINERKPVFVELGLQSMHEETARYIRRGYSTECFYEAVCNLNRLNIEVIAHIILGLPGESREMILNTVNYLSGDHFKVSGVKLQLLHVLEGTDLAEDYKRGLFETFGFEEYIELVADCVMLLPADMVIHRLTGDGPKALLIAPEWSSDKRKVLQAINKKIKEKLENSS